jgi:hypothetical protein
LSRDVSWKLPVGKGLEMTKAIQQELILEPGQPIRAQPGKTGLVAAVIDSNKIFTGHVRLLVSSRGDGPNLPYAPTDTTNPRLALDDSASDREALISRRLLHERAVQPTSIQRIPLSGGKPTGLHRIKAGAWSGEIG